MEQAAETLLDPAIIVDGHSEPTPAMTTEVAVAFPSPNWFFPRVMAVSSDGWVAYGSMTRGFSILYPITLNDGYVAYRVYIAAYAHRDRVLCVALLDNFPNERRLLTGSADGVVKQWNIREESGNVLLQPCNAHNVHKLENEEVVAMSYCGESVAVSVGTAGVLVKWDLSSNITRVYKKFLKNFRPNCMACSPHIPEMIAVGTKQGVLFVINLQGKASVLYRVRNHDDEILGLSWCPQAEVTVTKAPKYSASERLNQIRKSTSETSTATGNWQQPEKAPKSSEDGVGTVKPNNIEESHLDDTQDSDVSRTKDKDETVVEEDDTFDIYADHEHEEFGHKKYQPEEIRVPIEKSTENFDFLAECLKLKKDIMQIKEKPEESIHSLVESLQKAAIAEESRPEVCENNDGGNEKDDIDDNQKAESSQSENPGSSSTAETNGRKCKEKADKSNTTLTETYQNLLLTTDKNGKSCLWSKNGKLVASSVMPIIRSKQTRGTASLGALHWYRPDVLFCSDGKNTILECNPLLVDSQNKIEWKLLHSHHKRGVYCITSAAPSVQSADTEAPDCPVWSVGQDRNIILYSYRQREVVVTYSTIGGFVYNIQPCPYDSLKLCTASGDGAVRVCELGEDVARPYGSITCYWQNVQGKVQAAAWHPTRDSLLAFGTGEGRVGLIDTSGNKEKPSKVLGTPRRRGVYSVSWGENYTLYVCTVGELWVYNACKSDAEPVEMSVCFEGKRWNPTVVLWTERGLCVGARDGEVAVMSPQQPHPIIAAAFSFCKLVQCIAWHPQNVTLSEEPSPFKNWIACCANDNIFVILDFCEEDGTFKLKEVATVRGHTKSVVQAVWSPHRNGQILSTSQDSTVRVWNISAEGEVACVSVFDRHLFSVLTAVWWPQASHADRILSGGGDHSLRLWNFTEYSPELALAKQSANVKIPSFAMALPENMPQEKAKEKKQQTSNQNEKEKEGEDEDECQAGSMALPFKGDRKSSHKRYLLPMSTSQMVTNGIAGCRKLLKMYLEKNDGESAGSRVTYDTGLEFLKLFGSQDEFNELLDMEQERHLEEERVEPWVALGIVRGHVEKVFQTAIAHNALSHFLISIAPMVSHRFWKDQMQAQIALIDRRSASGEPHCPEYQRSGTPVVHRKLMMMLSQHDVMGAIQMMQDVGMYREAYTLVRVRHMHTLAAELLQKWAEHLKLGGSKVSSAICHLVLGQLVEASTVLSKSNDQEAWDVAAEIAKVTGQDTFAESLMKKKETASLEQRSEDILKDLPERLALHLKMRQSEAESRDKGNGSDVEVKRIDAKDLTEDDRDIEATRNEGRSEV